MADKRYTLEEKELLTELTEHPGMAVLWKEAAAALHGFEEQFVRYNLSAGNPTELAYLKCRAEGAAQLVAALKQRLSKPPKKRVVT